MSLPTSEDILERRTNLALQIARQRGELAEAYRNIEKPIHYAEYGLRGFGFLRKNPWVLSVLPAALSITSTLMRLRKGNVPKAPAPRPRQSVEARPKTVLGHAVKWGGHGWRLYKLYRRVRTYLP